jgi:hypothetical protein
VTGTIFWLAGSNEVLGGKQGRDRRNAATVMTVDLPNKGDVSDYFDAGHQRAELVALVKATPLYAPNSVHQASDKPAGDDLALTGIADLLAEPDDAIDWAVTDRLAAGSVNLLAGKPKAGKSTLARYLA